MLVADWSMRWSRDTFLIKLRLHTSPFLKLHQDSLENHDLSDFMLSTDLCLTKLFNLNTLRGFEGTGLVPTGCEFGFDLGIIKELLIGD